MRPGARLLWQGLHLDLRLQERVRSRMGNAVVQRFSMPAQGMLQQVWVLRYHGGFLWRFDRHLAFL